MRGPLLLLSLPLLAAMPHTALDDYVGTLSPNFTWFDTGHKVRPIVGGMAHILNVTSQVWMSEAEAAGPNGALWTHQVAVIIPHHLRYNQTSWSYLTGDCNAGPPKPPSALDEDLVLAASMAAKVGMITIVVYQLPNCPIVYPSDPSKRPRGEDAMIAWAWRQYLQDKDQDARWLPRLPMVKAAFACMKAATEWLDKTGMAQIDGWVVSGASKRGWTTWMVGATAPVCSWCPKVIGITPLVPIVPYLNHSVHLQRQSLGGFTFAFKDYVDADVLGSFDTPGFERLLSIVDPAHYLERFAKLPKLAVVSSDDEFMQLDWTQHGWASFPGETKLLVVPNSEHSLITGIPKVLSTLSAFVASIAGSQTPEERPEFAFSRDHATGTVTVSLTRGEKPERVTLRHAQTLSDQRRDFRWVRLANETSSPCHLPGISLPKPIMGGGDCVQPMYWHETVLTPLADGTYTATPPDPKEGHFTGYFVELIYPQDAMKNHLQISTPGFVWPDTLPFDDCIMRKGAPNECTATLV